MKQVDENLEWILCKTYFLIVETTNSSKIRLEELCKESKISKEVVEKIVPQNPNMFGIFFLKILMSIIDKEVLKTLGSDIAEDTISSTYDKLLEGLSLRFEKFIRYKQAFKVLSENSEQKIKIFFNILQENYNFSNSLLDLIEKEQNCGIKILKSIALNIVFIRCLEIFLEDENNNLDRVIRYLDKYLTDMEDLGVLIGIIKN